MKTLAAKASRALNELKATGTVSGWFEYRRLRRMPRYLHSETSIAGPSLEFVDAASFLSAWTSIFVNGIYDLPKKLRAPRILDCGANVGLASVRWKLRHPAAEIHAFEPDPVIVEVLRRNLNGAGFGDVRVHHAAVWDQDGTLRFVGDGADAGRVAQADHVQSSSKPSGKDVRTVSLRGWLNSPVDLLKLDIEGAELTVLRDIADRLEVVARLFVEYHGYANSGRQLHELLGLLAQGGFHTFVQSEYVPARPFLAQPASEGMDLRVNVFALSPDVMNKSLAGETGQDA